jgi:hypothetical protein
LAKISEKSHQELKFYDTIDTNDVHNEDEKEAKQKRALLSPGDVKGIRLIDIETESVLERTKNNWESASKHENTILYGYGTETDSMVVSERKINTGGEQLA